MTVILKHMSTTVSRVSAALGYDVVESMLAADVSLATVYAFAAQAACVADLTDEAPESARTVLATNMPTVGPRAA